MNPNTANVVDNDTYQPYARRTIHTAIGLIIAFVAMGAFIGWYFFAPSDSARQIPQEYQQTQQQPVSMPGNEHPEGSGQNAVYDFFYTMFGGIEEGLDDSPHNLNNVENLDDLNLDSSGNVSDSGIKASLMLNQMYGDEKNTQQQEPLEKTLEDSGLHEHSVADVVGREVVDMNDQKVGSVHDILVNKETGEAKVVIVEEDDQRYERDLKAVNFRNVVKQSPEGDVTLGVVQDSVKRAPDFAYPKIDNTGYVSLRNLYDGQLLDYEGKVAGEIEMVIYENADAQDIYFQLRPALEQESGSRYIKLPFKDAEIVENADGYDVKLTKEQTKALAERLFPKTSQQGQVN